MVWPEKGRTSAGAPNMLTKMCSADERCRARVGKNPVTEWRVPTLDQYVAMQKTDRGGSMGAVRIAGTWAGGQRGPS